MMGEERETEWFIVLRGLVPPGSEELICCAREHSQRMYIPVVDASEYRMLLAQVLLKGQAFAIIRIARSQECQ